MVTKNRRTEDNISVEDLMKKPAKELQIMSYVQLVKISDKVSDNEEDIEELKDNMKGKIGWKVFTWGAGVLTVIILAFGLINALGG